MPVSLGGSLSGGGLRDLVQPTHVEKLLRGQQRLETGLEDVRRSIDKLTEVISPHHLTGSVNATSPQMQRRPETNPPDELGVVFAHEHQPSFALAAFHQASAQAGHRSSYQDAFPMRSMPSYGMRTIATTNGDDGDSSSSTPFPAHTGRPPRQTSFNSSHAAYSPHHVFENLAASMARTNYSQVKELVKTLNPQSRRMSTTSIITGSEVLRKWGHTQDKGCVIHPASRLCAMLDAVRAVFLVNDVLMVPYLIAWDISVEGFLLFLNCVVATFWLIDIILNFTTGYISDGNVVVDARSIVWQYVKGSFVIDFIALLMEVIDLMATALQASLAPGSIKVFKALRFVKVTRLIRIVAKLRAGLLARIHSTLEYWIQVHGLVGFQHSLNFAALILRHLFVIAWLGHIGACVWYGVSRSLAHEEETWRLETTNMSSYLEGLYWSVSTMFSGASHTHPVNTCEVVLSMLWLVMGAMFVTSITSTLAATLIESQETEQETTKKTQALNAFMAQQKTPVLLSLAVQANFHQKLIEQKPLTELDLPFLEVLAPALRAALRGNQYSDGFMMLPFFRMLGSLSDGIVQALAFDASSVTVVKELEEVFKAQQEMAHAILLSDGTMKYGFEPTCHAPGRISLNTGIHEMHTQHHSSLLGSEDFSNTRISLVGADAWICELALLLSWVTMGSIVANSTCELLLVSADGFSRLVSSHPMTATVTAAYAYQLSEVLHTLDDRLHCTDIDPGVDHDVVLCTVHMSIKGGLVSRPIMDLLRRQHWLTAFMRKDLHDLEREVSAGKCHLVMGQDGPSSISRVVRVVVLHLTNKEGLTCVQLAENRNGSASSKFRLPGCKVLGSETPHDAVKRLLRQQLSTLAAGIRIIDMETNVEFGSSHSYGLRTKYIRYIHTAELVGHLEKETSLPPGDNAGPLVTKMTSERSQRSGRSGTGVPLFGKGNSIKSAGEPSSNWPLARLKSRAQSRIWHDKGTGPETCPVLSTVSGQPFATDGLKHAFAVQHADDDDMAHRENSRDLPRVSGIIRVYRWMDETDFDMLMTRHEEVEAELSPVTNGLPASQWLTMLSWKLVIEPGDVVNIDNKEMGILPHVREWSVHSGDLENQIREWSLEL